MRPLLIVVCLTGCATPPADLGKSCHLVRAGADGGAEQIPRSDPTIAFGANQDVLSFGATECSTKICVRQRNWVDAAGEMDPIAKGNCTGACGPCGSGYTCRALLLDEQTLAALRMSDPERYKAIFGEATMPNFCVPTD